MVSGELSKRQGRVDPYEEQHPSGFRRMVQHEEWGVSYQTLPRAEHPRGSAESNAEGEGVTVNPSPLAWPLPLYRLKQAVKPSSISQYHAIHSETQDGAAGQL